MNAFAQAIAAGALVAGGLAAMRQARPTERFVTPS